MDVVLGLTDHYFFTPFVYPESVPEDTICWDSSYLWSIVTMVGGSLLYLITASLSYAFVFDKNLLQHPQILEVCDLLTTYSRFPPIREIKENLEDFFQSGKSGKTGGFQPKSGKKFQIRELFFKTIFKPFNLEGKCFFKTVKPVRKLHLMRQHLHRLKSLRPHFKRINMFFLLQCLDEN